MAYLKTFVCIGLFLTICSKSFSIGSVSTKFLYVSPGPDRSRSSKVECPREVDNANTYCETMEYYLENTHLYENTTVVKFLFLQGFHMAAVHTNFSRQESVQLALNSDLELIGLGSPENVNINEFNSILTLPGHLLMTNITLNQSNVYVYKPGHHGQKIAVDIVNCKFHETSSVFSQANISVKHSEFGNSSTTAIKIYHSVITFYDDVAFIGNSGYEGGALVIVGSKMYVESNSTVLFYSNHASRVGGAIYVANSKLHAQKNYQCGDYRPFCFYILKGSYLNSTYRLNFINNTAGMGGEHVYGDTLKSDCISTSSCDFLSFQTIDKVFRFHPDFDSSLSVSSDGPSRVCICDGDRHPQCTNYVFMTDIYPGATFNVSLVVVGGDLGATSPGTVHASMLSKDISGFSSLGDSTQYTQVTKSSKHCTNLRYTVLSNASSAILQLVVTRTSQLNYLPSLISGNYMDKMDRVINDYYVSGKIDDQLRLTPVFINFTILPCPPGFAFQETLSCDCLPQLRSKNAACSINTLQESFTSWNAMSMWVGVASKALVLSEYCPFDYCVRVEKSVDLLSNLDDQCAFNRAGKLCGGCKKGFSLAIGSSHCIRCTSNAFLALLVVFAAAGILLVVLINALRLTVTQGMVDGLIFYANIVWTYRTEFSLQDASGVAGFLKVFIAWLNLDFGIETCFSRGLDAYTKTWLQFLFPLYIWSIAGIMIFAAHKSTRLTKLFGNRAVPTLDTLFLLSYIKILRTIVDTMQVSFLTSYTNSTLEATERVWSLDGRIVFFGYKHTFLFLAATAALIFLCLPYTLFLLFAQWLRRVSHHRFLNWIARLNPIFDTHFAPLKDAHQYWFGVLLLVRVILIMLTVSSAIGVNLLILLITTTLLLAYMAVMHLYKNKFILMLQSTYFVNLICFSAAALYTMVSETDRMNRSTTVAIYLSLGVAFFQFCLIVLWSTINEFWHLYKKNKKSVVDREDNCTPLSSDYYRDSILNESQDL